MPVHIIVNGIGYHWAKIARQEVPLFIALEKVICFCHRIRITNAQGSQYLPGYKSLLGPDSLYYITLSGNPVINRYQSAVCYPYFSVFPDKLKPPYVLSVLTGLNYWNSLYYQWISYCGMTVSANYNINSPYLFRQSDIFSLPLSFFIL